MALTRATLAEVGELADFLARADLTLSSLDSPDVRIWIERDSAGAMVGCVGWEVSADGQHALIRSVAVVESLRASGSGTRLARFALDQAAAEGATRAWLFSRRSGGFWSRLGFEPAERDALADALATTHQVALFRSTGRLEHEVAWTLAL